MKVLPGPAHELLPFVKVGVTVILAKIGAEVVFVAVKEILLLPLAARPIAVLSLFQA